MIGPKDDYNNAFSNSSFAQLTEHGYRVMYFEAGRADVEIAPELARIIRQVGTQKKPVLIELGGHGSRLGSSFGVSQAATSTLTTENARVLQQARASDFVAPGCQIFLKSCKTGSGIFVIDNLANALAKVFPNADVWAPRLSLNNQIWFRADGSLGGPGYDSQGGNIYRIRGRSP